MKKSKLDPVIQSYEPGGSFLLHCPGMIYNIGRILLVYYYDVQIGEVILLFQMPLFFIASHNSYTEGGGGGRGGIK